MKVFFTRIDVILAVILSVFSLFIVIFATSISQKLVLLLAITMLAWVIVFLGIEKVLSFISKILFGSYGFPLSLIVWGVILFTLYWVTYPSDNSQTIGTAAFLCIVSGLFWGFNNIVKKKQK